MQRRYRRYFIMLGLEDKSSVTSINKEAKGYAKVEIKNNQGTLGINCQNLKGGNNGDRYRWYLINTKKDGEPTIVEVGPMEIDERGKGEIVWEFNTENVRGSMEQIDNFNVLVLAVQNKDDKKKLFIPLIGYIDRERPSSWRYALERYLYIPSDMENMVEEETLESKQIEEIEYMEQDEDIIKEPSATIECINEDVCTDANEAINVNVDEAIKIDINEDTNADMDEADAEADADAGDTNIDEKDANIDEEDTNIEAHRHIEDTDGKVTDESKLEISEHEAQMQAYVENSLKDFAKIEPFINGLEHYTWWQIPYNPQTMYRSYMPFILYLDSLKGSTSYYISKTLQIICLQQHHIFGICYDENNKAKYYAYGIPGKNLPLDQPYVAGADLTYWHPCNNVPLNIESHGYWILSIDPKTGDTTKNT